MSEYKVLVGCQNDATGKRFELGDTGAEGDFPQEVIAVWVEQGVLELVEAKPESATGEA